MDLYLQQQRLSQDDRPHHNAAPPISNAVAASDAFASLPGDRSECDDDMIVDTFEFLDDDSSSVDDHMCNNELLDDHDLLFDDSAVDTTYQKEAQPLQPRASLVTVEEANVETDDANERTSASSIKLSPTYVGLARIHEMAMKSGVSLSFVDDILGVIKSHVGFDINDCPLRKTFFEHIRKIDAANGSDPVLPSRVPIDNGSTSFPTFSILSQLMDLINSALFQELDNLVVSDNNDLSTLFQKFQCKDEDINLEVHSAKWYSDTFAKLVLNPELDWLVPLIFYIDKTGTDANQRFPLEPLMVTTSLLKKSVRENSDAWRHLGFLPTCDDPQASAEESLEHFHLSLSKILDDLIELQRNPPVIEFSIGGIVYKKRLLLPVAFIMGDQMSQDKLCGRKAINAGGAGRIHRGCMCSQLHASSPCGGICKRVDKKRILELTHLSRMTESETKDIVRENIPTPITMTLTIEKRIKKERLSLLAHLQRRTKFARATLERVYSMYPIKNAWTDVCFGSNENGVYRATLDDPMHYCDSGSFFYLIQVAFLSMTTKERLEMEDIIKQHFKGKRSSMRDDFPRGKFTAGFSRTTLLTAGEKTGLVFALNLALGTAEGTALYTKVITRLQQKYDQVLKTDGKLKLGDKHFFADLRESSTGGKLDRTLLGVRKLVGAMRRHEVLYLVDTSYDELQTEYLLQSVHAILGSESVRYPATPTINGLYSSSTLLSKEDSLKADILFELLRKDQQATHELNGGSECGGYSSSSSSSSSTSQDSPPSKRPSKKRKARPRSSPSSMPKKYVKKHKWDRSKSNVAGSTSAILTDLEGFRKVLMHGLAFHSFVHYFEEIPSEKRSDGVYLQECVNDFIKMYSEAIYRGDDGVDCETPKIHAHLHLPADIIEFGHPMNWDAGKGERGLKDWAKMVSSTVQQQTLSEFTYQTAMRISDCALLLRVQQGYVQPKKKTRTNIDTDQWFCKFPHLEIDTFTETVSLVERRKGKQELWSGPPMIHRRVLRFLKTCERRVTTKVLVWNDGKLKINGHMKSIRASSRFDSRGQFYDWVYVKADRDDERTCYPAKLLLLFKDKDDEMCAIVQGCEWQNHAEKGHNTPMSTRWSLEFKATDGSPELRKVSLEDVVDVLYTVEHEKEDRKGLGFNTHVCKIRGKCCVDVVEPRYMWASNFTVKERRT